MTIRKMMATISAAVAAASLVGAVGCNDPQRDQAKADEQRREATDKTEQAKREAREEINAAQNKAAEAQRSANDSLAQARAEYRAKTQRELDAVDAKIAELTARADTAELKTRATINESIRDLRVKRETLSADLRQIDTATADAWEQLKTKVDDDVSAVHKTTTPSKI
jgi:hypothetical protein